MRIKSRKYISVFWMQKFLSLYSTLFIVYVYPRCSRDFKLRREDAAAVKEHRCSMDRRGEWDNKNNFWKKYHHQQHHRRIQYWRRFLTPSNLCVGMEMEIVKPFIVNYDVLYEKSAFIVISYKIYVQNSTNTTQRGKNLISSHQNIYFSIYDINDDATAIFTTSLHIQQLHLIPWSHSTPLSVRMTRSDGIQVSAVAVNTSKVIRDSRKIRLQYQNHASWILTRLVIE